MPVSTCARLRWLLRASLIPPILHRLARGEGAERRNWERIERERERERIERKTLAHVPANPSLFRDLARLACDIAHRHRGLVARVRVV